MQSMGDSSLNKARDEEHRRIGRMFNGFRQKLTEYETLMKTELGELYNFVLEFV